MTQLLYALVKHDVSGLPVAGTLRVTEDAVEKPIAKVGPRWHGDGLSAQSAVMNYGPVPGSSPAATRRPKRPCITRKG